MQRPICLDSLGELDNGAARLVIDAAIRAAVGDLDDRGEDGKPRTVTIKLHLAKMDGGQVVAHVEAGTKVPSYKTAATVSRLARTTDGRSVALFQELAPAEPEQRTIDETFTQERGDA